MAQEVKVVCLDDINLGRDGVRVEAEETVEFSLRGAELVIDLSPEHVKELDAALEPFIRYARRRGASALHLPEGGKTASGRKQAELIRQFGLRKYGPDHDWGKLNPGDYIPKPLREEFLAAAQAGEL